jgi:hypothetical protein
MDALNPNSSPDQDPNLVSPEVGVSPEVLADLKSWEAIVEQTKILLEASNRPNVHNDPNFRHSKSIVTLNDGTNLSTIGLYSNLRGGRLAPGDISLSIEQKVDGNNLPIGQRVTRVEGHGSQIGLFGKIEETDGTTKITLERDDVNLTHRENIEVTITPNDDGSERVELISELDDENSYIVNPDYDPWVGNEKYLKIEKPVSVADRIAKKMDVKNSRLWKAISTRFDKRQARNNGDNQPQDGSVEPASELMRNIKGSIATVPAALVAGVGMVVLGKFGYGLVSNPEKAVNLANNGVIERGKELLGDPWSIVVGLGRSATTGAFFAGATTGLLGDAQLVDNPFSKDRDPRGLASYMPAKAMTWIERGEQTKRSEAAAKRRVTWALGAAANFALLGNGLPGVAYGFGALSGRIAGRTLQRFGPGAYESLINKIKGEGEDEEQTPDDQTGPTPNQPQSPPPPAANDPSPPSPDAGTPPPYDPPRGRRPGGRLIGEPAPATGVPAPNVVPAVDPRDPRNGRNSSVM